MTTAANDTEFPLPWSPAPHAPWILIAANQREVANFIAWSDNAGALIVAEAHCAEVAAAMNRSAPASPAPSDLLDAPEYNRNDLRVIQHLVVQWADNVFPDRHPAMAFLKFFEEIGELVRKPTEPTEYADIIIMLVDLAHMHGVTDLGAAVHAKMKINANRSWTQTAAGTMQHDPTGGSNE